MPDDGAPTTNVALEGILRLDEFEPIARERLEPAAYEYYAGGSASELTMRDNVGAFDRYRLMPRVLVDVSSIDTTTTFLGTPVPHPFGLAPNAAQGLADPEGEKATARAAGEAGTLMILSTFSSFRMDEVARAGRGPKWFQLYVHKDPGIAKEMIRRAEEAGYEAIVVTVDLPVGGYRERELRTPFVTSQQQAFPNLPVETSGKSILELLDGVINASLTWDDLEWIRSATSLPVLVKGILSPEDARLCVEHGVQGVVVSNHGGRQLDRAPAAIDALEGVVQAVSGACEVFMDSGIRRGTDVVTALALGARGVFIGRPYLYALAAGGSAGVKLCIELLDAEVKNAMALLGSPAIEHLSRDRVIGPG